MLSPALFRDSTLIDRPNNEDLVSWFARSLWPIAGPETREISYCSGIRFISSYALDRRAALSEHRPIRRRRLALWLVAALTILVAAITCSFLRGRYDVRIALSRSRSRITEGRLAEIAWGSEAVQRADLERGSANLTSSINYALSQAAEYPDFSFKIESDPRAWFSKAMSDPKKLSNIALAMTARGHTEAGARAFELAAVFGQDSRLSSDAAAVRLQQADDSKDLSLALRGLVLADRAIRLDHENPEAHFNRALALEKLGLENAAIASYRRSLSSGNALGWRYETELRIGRLSHQSSAERWTVARAALESASQAGDELTVSQIVREFPQQARTAAEGEYLGRWAHAIQTNRLRDAELALGFARHIGNALRNFSGESLLTDAVRAVDQSSAHRATLNAILRGHSNFELATTRVGLARAVMFDEAATQFAAGGSPLAQIARLLAACARFDAGATDDSLNELRQIVNSADPGYVGLIAQLEEQIGMELASQGKVYPALQSYDRAAEGFECLGEIESACRVASSRAHMLHFMGDPITGWQTRHSTFTTASRSGDRDLMAFVLSEAAYDQMFERNWDGARALYEVALSLPPTSDARRRFEIKVLHALIASPSDLTSFQPALTSIDEPAKRADARNDLQFAEAIASWYYQPQQAVVLLTNCIEYSRRTRHMLMLPYVYLYRAAAYRRLFNDGAALADLEQSILLLEDRRRGIARTDLRDVSLVTADDVFDELFETHWRRAEYRQAFELSERRLGTIFLDGHGGSLTTEEIAHGLKPGEAILVLNSSPLHALVTVIEPNRFSTKPLADSRRALIRMKSALRDAIRDDHRQQAELISERLYDAVIGAVKTEDITTLVIVTDSLFCDLPFPFLRDRRSGKYLIEQCEILRVPSASVFIRRRDVRAFETRAHSLVAIGDPAFDRTVFPSLPYLPAAVDESRKITKNYGTAHTLIRRDASFENFAEFAPDADVIDIASHIVGSTGERSIATLLFASDDTRSGACAVSEIPSLVLKDGSTVVVAGCRSAIGSNPYGDLSHFAGAFLAAGARNVIATLWDVDDETSRDFSVRFHRALKTGNLPPSAVRIAQLSMLRSTDRRLSAPSAWSGFQTYALTR